MCCRRHFSRLAVLEHLIGGTELSQLWFVWSCSGTWLNGCFHGQQELMLYYYLKKKSDICLRNSLPPMALTKSRLNVIHHQKSWIWLRPPDAPPPHPHPLRFFKANPRGEFYLPSLKYCQFKSGFSGSDLCPLGILNSIWQKQKLWMPTMHVWESQLLHVTAHVHFKHSTLHCISLGAES